jgi:hypothetical protein
MTSQNPQRAAGPTALQAIAARLRDHGITTRPGSGHLTVPLQHGAAIWISEDPDTPGITAQYHRGDTEETGDRIALPSPEHPGTVADTIAAAARSIQAYCRH